ncbi:MAG: hypothetical protein LKG27_02065 [Clostridiaceae bacterium]|nr:hypothetical protein [Clostridiaceae bacterium]
MKKLLSGLLIIGCITSLLPAFAEEDVTLSDVDKPKLVIPKPEVKKTDTLVVNDEAVIAELVRLQKEKDLDDIEKLWKGTVSNDQVIAFAIKKLSTPESQRRIHSSLMAKTLSALVAGSSLVPYTIGSNYTTQMAGLAVGRLAQNLIVRKTMPQEIPLTDTEVIELASLVESLQDRIINAYYNYKSALSQLKESRARLILYNKNYAKAMDDEDILEITISSAMYDNMRMEEEYYFQMAEKYHLELQRLAGKKTVDSLNLYQYNYNSTLVNNKAVSK